MKIKVNHDHSKILGMKIRKIKTGREQILLILIIETESSCIRSQETRVGILWSNFCMLVSSAVK